MVELQLALYQEIAEFKMARARPIQIKSFTKVGFRNYKLELSSAQVASFVLVALIKIPDGYPDRACQFILSLTPGRTASKGSTAAEEERKNVLTKFPFDESPVEPILIAVKREIEEYYDNFCDGSRY